MERILRNAGRASIDHPFTKEGLIDTICQTVRSTGNSQPKPIPHMTPKGKARYLLSALRTKQASDVQPPHHSSAYLSF